MLQIGQTVRVLEPFTQNFPDTYIIQDIVVNPDGGIVYTFEDIGGFDGQFLEVIQ